MEENKVAIQINHKAFEMIQEFNDDPEKRLRLYDLIFRCSFLGVENSDEDMAVRMTAKSILYDIQECRNKYIEKCKKNGEYGIQGRDYGIEGKNYGLLGGEYGIQGGRPKKRPDVYEKIYNFILSDENYIKSALSEDKTQKRMLCRNIKTRIPEVAENNDENSKLINGVIKKIKEENNNNNGDNKVQ